MHVELHFCQTANEAAKLGYGGLPRYDLEPSKCDKCQARVGEVSGQDGAVFWKPLVVVVWEDGIAALCTRCSKPVIDVVS